MALFKLLNQYRHIEKELKKYLWLANRDIHVQQDPTNPRHFDVTIIGPKASPYEGTPFQVEVYLPEQYPLIPPIVRFVSNISHPNIDDFGYIQNSFLGSRWIPSFGIHTTLLIIQELLKNPKGAFSNKCQKSLVGESSKSDKLEDACLNLFKMSL
ncbi:ubiquitin-conjugating enzyme E2 N [Nephila pilipes]|uniref:Ubiquitin-conjugating enzyme E2 N n=1 Tax=Nephila pilipes TaxID=299642 RepID=A0A8X6U4G0_NEPPI|nr:ubiquitin-conjugating enzyme E2 N [Nephila pilipes]GFT77450.1 ubiquitin-conjugating enzyme E2 N [Nephila pilipes]GFU08711.1 ubiquitin-conjugating enzyme E2 N [Nephila pilipes]GFU24331.1 ubiquitin-conjugating enzyme E2 N [Nephila pilipes]